MFLYIIDEKLSLKLTEVSDADRLFELTENAREYLKKWLPWLDFTTDVEDTREFLKGTMKGYAEHKSMTTVILYEGEIVGTAGFNSINWSNKTAYIGYWLGHEYQGKGIMTKVAKALTDYAFNHLKLNKVEIRAAEENKKSRGIPERLGFINEGRIRQAEWLYDHYVDHVVYGILAEEWDRNKNLQK
ncbi:GNAT family protein [Bacillus sp. ISL-55]|uniref:GNAT family N-acetyltransferase n=1 Tax=Bacillus sp. ISL-55 TaxID=2819134 RepID=UPI001BE97564|nr:GNAT family protein [Bacillus sp. ISL-55]MBT2692051.1 GNAT family N-acetyltransferase [Bacillus sp. ISL-55]